MKTKKLNQNDLKIESFVTSMEESTAATLKGGVSVQTCSPFLSLGSEGDCTNLSIGRSIIVETK